MRHGISLRIRIFTILTFLIGITLTGGLILVWYTFRMESLLTAITEKDLASFETAAALETALVNQKGFVSYYFMDGNPDWLKQLGEFRQMFKEHLDEARQQADSENERNALKMIESDYQQYIIKKDRVIELYKAGERAIGSQIHPEVRRHFASVLKLCEKYRSLHRDRIASAKAASQLEATRLRIIAAIAMLISFILAVLLALVLAKQILGPVRQLALMAIRDPEMEKSRDEVKALSRGVRGLIEDVDQTHLQLEKSRESLLQAEKLALVGKLAAGMAHSIRNPFTSVKMRLFSLGRSLQLSDIQKEDFDVISAEIRHIDTIVQNFLEFSRPPKLKMRSISPSTVVDLAIQLLKHRLKSYNVTMTVERKVPLPKIYADPEQLKEVLVNLIVNACEAMTRGGSIVIREEETSDPSDGTRAVIRVSDNGPGIAERILDKVLQPFFTTKEEGTGLGLSIAARIIEEHRGRMDVQSKEGHGTTFIITLPVQANGV